MYLVIMEAKLYNMGKVNHMVDGKKVDVIKVTFRQKQDQYIATSKDLRGLFMADSSYDVLKSILPEAIQLLYKSRGKNVHVKPVNPENVDQSPSEIDYYAIAA